MTGRARREALTRARTRRLELDADRAERERRIESATADVLVLLKHRADRLQGVTDIEVAVGLAMRSLVQANVGLRDIAFCCDVTLAEVRRLLARSEYTHGTASQNRPAGPGQPAPTIREGAAAAASDAGQAGPTQASAGRS